MRWKRRCKATLTLKSLSLLPFALDFERSISATASWLSGVSPRGFGEGGGAQCALIITAHPAPIYTIARMRMSQGIWTPRRAVNCHLPNLEPKSSECELVQYNSAQKFPLVNEQLGRHLCRRAEKLPRKWRLGRNMVYSLPLKKDCYSKASDNYYTGSRCLVSTDWSTG